MLATITSKGQVTLPKSVREKLNLKPGDRLDFQVMPDGTFIGRPATRSALDIVGILARPGRKPVSIQEMDEGIGRIVSELDNLSKT